MKKRKYKSKVVLDSASQVAKNSGYKLTKDDERIIRRYVLILQDTAPKEYLIETMAYVFRTTVQEVKNILAGTTDKELCNIALVRERWKNNADKPKGGYISRRILL